MNPAFNTHSRTLFTAAATVVLGLQVAPWPTTLTAQEIAPAQLIVQSQARPITPAAPSGQQQYNNIQRPAQLAQQPQQRSGPPQYPKSEVRRELEKLYEQNGREIPEMVDPQFSQPAEGQSGGMSPAMPPQAQSAPQDYSATPVSAPKKKGFFGRLFGSKNDGPTQPPAELPYTPPSYAMPMTPPAAMPMAPPAIMPGGQPANSGLGAPNYSQLFQQPQQTPASAVPQQPVQQPQQFAQQPQLQPVAPQNLGTVFGQTPAVAAPANDGFEAPLYVETPEARPGNGLPAINFSAPVAELDAVDLGQPAPLTATEQRVAPVDPFSDEALFPGSSTAAPAARNVEPDNVAAVEAAPAAEIPAAIEAAPAEENPYSGLTLDEDPYANLSTVRVAKPAPAETVETSPPVLMVPPNSENGFDEPPLVVGEPDVDLPSRLSPAPRSGNERTRAKQEMIAARHGLRGLKGFCPVVLRDDRDLVDAHSEFRVVYNSKTYYLSSSQSVSAFHSDPAKYAPAARGNDVIQQAITGEQIEGSLDFAVWYKGRLYMFSSAETMDTFVSAPSSHATLD